METIACDWELARMNEFVVSRVDERGVLAICLDHEARRNALNEAAFCRLRDLFKTASSEPSIRVVVLRGNGGVFCAGGDIGWMKECASLGADARLEKADLIYDLFDTIERCSKPTACIVQGAALGGAVGLLAACDFVLALSDAVIGTTEAALGIVPACVSPFLLRKIGAASTQRLFLSASHVSAAEAKALGLVHHVADCPVSLKAAEEQLLDRLLGLSPCAQAAAKSLLQHLSLGDANEANRRRAHAIKVLAESWASPDGQEGMQAFLEKRPPRWL